MRLTKGSAVLVQGIWYVVIELMVTKQGGVTLNCICDHANNIHNFSFENVTYSLTPYESVQGNFSYEVSVEISKRPLPFEVMVEALIGYHDHRFGHWGTDD